jgi:cell division protein FtsB
MIQRHVQRYDLWVTLFCLVGVGSFVWHGFAGGRGVPLRDKLTVEALALQDELASAADIRDRLERRVKLMRPETMDPDMADELARTQLKMGQATDFIARFQP